MTTSTTPMLGQQCVRVRLVLNYGGEDVALLRQRLVEAWPASLLDVVELHDESEKPRVIVWRLPFEHGYGQESGKVWMHFRKVLLATWTRDQAEEALCYGTYTIMRGDKLVGVMERLKDAGGDRDYLDGRPVSCGTALEALLDSGVWLPGRYEMAHHRNGTTPMFHFGLWRGEASFAIGDSTILRWPVR